jgi:nucleoside-diphosphate-sugar epimerase
VINVAIGGRVSLNELFRTLKDLTGAAVEPIYAETRAGDVRDSQADIGKAHRLLGYQPTVTLEQGLEKTVAWFRKTQMTTA